ncbi:aryl-sulfate sulfotransferase [Halobaculum sp. MBLA0143]|uniref:aryl-sulfate sulfotransferase n=1 Tax=Halobaculum sp. MBLA0143 TaxID=3079933 RepID=UPI00352466A6
MSRLAVRPLTLLRLLALAAALLAVVALGQSALAGDPAVGAPATTDDTLVATVDGTGPGQIVAYGPDGNLQYRNQTWDIYHDVDPSPVGDRTVEYVASDQDAADCDGCLLNVVERLNLTTGEVTRLYTTVADVRGSKQIHDVDRVNDSVLLIADISHPDRVYTVNTTTGEVLWEWRVSSAFSPDSGGRYPADWTHLNDVELLPDGRVMVNLRNHDQVVFLEPGEGVQANWTLGADGAHDRLYEPHNPDYIPRSRGGPAVLIADSENNRLVEYRRTDGNWTRTWRWADRRLQWPRDADRLPSGRTLVADSHGSRVLVVGRNGSVAASAPFPDGVYDVELLGTGDESRGPTADRAGLTSRTPEATGLAPAYRVARAAPPLVLHGLLFVLPTWTTTADAATLLVTVPVVAVWLLVEGVAWLWRR